MIRWLRVVWPPWGVLLLVFLPYLVFEAFFWWVEWRIGRALPLDTRPSLSLLLFAGGLYGAYRVLAFHPVLRPSYRAWLEMSPWTGRKPLPLGPIHLVLQDVLLIGLVMAAGWPLHGPGMLDVLASFALAYLAILGISLALTGGSVAAYAVAFCLGLEVRVWRDSYLWLAVALMTYLLGYVSLRRALARFPWPAKRPIQSDFLTTPDKYSDRTTLGWPFVSLAPKFLDENTVSWGHALTAGALAGWWAYVIGSLVSDPGDRFGLLLTILFVGSVLVPVGRLMRYTSGYQAPISLAGRIFTGRWIIKGYDQVFVAPALSFWVGVTIPVALLMTGLPPELAVPPGLAASLAIGLGLGPDLKTWRLTGHHRLTVPLGQKANVVQVG